MITVKVRDMEAVDGGVLGQFEPHEIRQLPSLFEGFDGYNRTESVGGLRLRSRADLQWVIDEGETYFEIILSLEKD